MASTIWEFFGYRVTDQSQAALDSANTEKCPITKNKCEKNFRNGKKSGVCTLKPMTSEPVICCPIRLYADNYRILQEVSDLAFTKGLPLIPGREAVKYSIENKNKCVAVFGKNWGGELRLPQKDGKGGYFVDWVLALLSDKAELQELVAVEVQTIDTTGNYGNGYEALIENRNIVKTTAGLNWENVSKRILPQLIYKGQLLQREELCKKGLFFVCPTPVYSRIMARLGGQQELVRYSLQPASITFLSYSPIPTMEINDGEITPLTLETNHTTTVYKVQEAFNNVTLPEGNVFQNAIIKALGI